MWVVPLALLLFLDLDGLNPLVAFPDAGVADALLNAVWVAWLAVMGATVAVLVARWWAASGPRRRALLPTLAGALALVLFAAMLIHDIFNETRSEVLMWIAHLTLLAVPAALLAGMLRSRLARGGLTDLFHRLGSESSADLEAAIRRVLGDPAAVLAFAGSPAPGPGQRITPVGRAAALVYDSSLDEDPELVEAVGAAAAVAIDNERLRAEADQRLDDLKASRERIVAASDAERRRLERNLHDGAQQRLVGIALQLRLLQRRLGDDPAAAQLAATASDELGESLAELRELARGMHPAVLEHGLPAALGALASRSTVATTVSCETRERLPDPVELTAYFVASEALANIAKYSSASHATVRLWRGGPHACIEIADDGIGGADAARGSGLRGLTDRVEALDGHLRVVSRAGAGTTVTAELPCR